MAHTQYKKQLAYETMLSQGMPDLLAASIANQFDGIGFADIIDVTKSEYIYEVLIGFQDWEKTIEGFEFWAQVTESIGEVGEPSTASIPVKVHTCFPCPARSVAGYVCMRTGKDVSNHIKEGSGVHPNCPYMDTDHD